MANARADLEARVAAALRNISPENAERIARDIARDFSRLTYPELFRHMVIQGTNAENQTRTGWPDTFAEMSDGRIFGIEGTREKGSWKKHLDEDLKKAANHSPKLGGYIHVNAYPNHQPTQEERKPYLEKFSVLGIPPENIHLVIGMDLVTVLTRPEFAATRLELLGIAERPKPLSHLVDTIPRASPLGKIIPTMEEYESGLVTLPPKADDAWTLLNEPGVLLMQGIGASGKTVLAKALGLRWRREERGPVYYLDLAEIGDEKTPELLDALRTLSHPSILVILDNVHLADQTAEQAWITWRDQGGSSAFRLFLVGREVRNRTESLMDSHVECGELRGLILRAGPVEARGVVRRLAAARLEISDPTDLRLPDPPETAVQQWIRTFGGMKTITKETDLPPLDLIALGAAVDRALAQNRFGRGEWSLSEDDAVEEIWNRYLMPLGKAERRNALRLASLPEDMYIPREALVDDTAEFDELIKSGVVFRVERGEGKYVQFGFCHGALYRLFRKASRTSVDVMAHLKAVAEANAFSGLLLVGLLRMEGMTDESKMILKAIWRRRNWLTGLQAAQVLPFLGHVVAAKLADWKAIDKLLSAQAEHVRDMISRSYLSHVGSLFQELTRVCTHMIS